MSWVFFSQNYFDLLKLIILKRRNTAQKYLFPKVLACIYANKNERTISCGGGKNPGLILVFLFFFLFLLPYRPSTNTQILDASLPVPGVNEDASEHDAPPQDPQQPGAVTAPQELDGQQPEAASPHQEPPGEQAEPAGTNGK